MTESQRLARRKIYEELIREAAIADGELNSSDQEEERSPSDNESELYPAEDDSNDSSNDFAGDDFEDLSEILPMAHLGLGEVIAAEETESGGDDSDEALVGEEAQEEEEEEKKEQPRVSSKKRGAAGKKSKSKRSKKSKIGSSAAAAAAAPAGSGPVLTPSALDTMQQFMDDCRIPRDVGRVLNRLSTLGSIKAVEWMNWYSMLMVPTIRELLLESNSKSHRLQEKHLELIILIQRLVTIVRAHSIQFASLGDLHEGVRQLLITAAACFPDDSGCVSPNMHLALHLRSQILDYGPPSGFWCMPYERANGLLGRVPYSRSAPAISTAKRAVQMITMACQSPDGVAYGRTVDTPQDAPPGAGFTHALHKTRHNNGTHHIYTFTDDDDGRAAKQRLMGWRDGSLMGDVNGYEPFPGFLCCSRGGGPREVHIDMTHEAAFPHQTATVRKDLLKLPHLKACLRSHYLEAHKSSLVEYVKRLGAFDGDLDALQGDTQRSKVRRGKALVHDGVRMWLDDEAIFAKTVRIYDKLMFAGESFDSVLSSSDSNNSYVAVVFDTKTAKALKTYLWYGRVSYYVEHTFNGHVHKFAAVRYYLFLHESGNTKGMRNRYVDAAGLPVPLRSRLAQSSLTQFPVVQTEFHPDHTQDLVPVHRLMHRWIPCPIPRPPPKADATGGAKPGTAAPKLQHVCPVPTRIHF